jgi:hypothetical protein
VLLLGLGLLCACSGEVEPTPSEILGIWTTGADRYADRIFEVREDAVLFGTGRFGAPKLHSIVSSEAVASKTVESPGCGAWLVSYREVGGSVNSIDLTVCDGPEPTLQFANRSEIWRRADVNEESRHATAK